MSTFKDVTLHFNDMVQGAQLNLKAIRSGTFSLDPGSVTNAQSAEQQVTLRGIEVGDVIVLLPPASLAVGLVYSGVRVSAADTIQVRLSCHAAAPVDDTARTWTYMYFDLT